MTFDPCLVYYECYICELTRFQKAKHITVQIGLWHLDSNVQHPDVIKRKLAVIATEHIQLSLYYIGCVSAARSWSIVARLDFLP